MPKLFIALAMVASFASSGNPLQSTLASSPSTGGTPPAPTPKFLRVLSGIVLGRQMDGVQIVRRSDWDGAVHVSVSTSFSPAPPMGALELYVFRSREDHNMCRAQAMSSLCSNYLAAATSHDVSVQTVELDLSSLDFWVALRNVSGSDVTLDGEIKYLPKY